MKIAVICSSRNHPVFPHLERWRAEQSRSHEVELLTGPAEARGGDLLFLVSCTEIVGAALRQRYRAGLVLHASRLPEGRGWSPHIWQIVEGRSELTVSLIEANDPVDSGAIWAQRRIELAGHELYDEINAKLFDAELALMTEAVEQFGRIRPRPQEKAPATYYRRRTPEDSRIDPQQPIAAHFNLLRVADPERYPAFFELHGHRYRIRIEKMR